MNVRMFTPCLPCSFQRSQGSWQEQTCPGSAQPSLYPVWHRRVRFVHRHLSIDDGDALRHADVNELIDRPLIIREISDPRPDRVGVFAATLLLPAAMGALGYYKLFLGMIFLDLDFSRRIAVAEMSRDATVMTFLSHRSVFWLAISMRSLRSLRCFS